MPIPIVASGVYKIISASRHSNGVITLKDGIPRGDVVVQPPRDPLAPYQKWAVIDEFDGISTLKSRITKFENRTLSESKKPYAQNSVVNDIEVSATALLRVGSIISCNGQDPYIRSGALAVFSAYRIKPVNPDDPNNKLFTISLPERNPLTVWTIADNGTNILLLEYGKGKDKDKDTEGQHWMFEQVEDSE
ncbi:hypothetical protein B0F90DRAFT_369169 [Multifurca ochricompacta]|uniref:Uncharacterized protein n=1 Tax=Multifurca ochricompacta TaxID=376703 RepID=A0AAD4QJD0_9AGAM|nr:hypothetical protein B0F90DRAFT_369169 [Multifurca ochricompacta]